MDGFEMLAWVASYLWFFMLRDIRREMRGLVMATATKPAPQRVVRVWFGEHKIAEYKAEPALAGRYNASDDPAVPELARHQLSSRPTGRYVVMIGPARRLALGYLRWYPLMSPTELGRWQQRMAETATTRGLVLGTVHVEELPTQPQAFEALLASIRALDVAAVIVPP